MVNLYHSRVVYKWDVMAMLQKAIAFAKKVHRGSKRKSGDPYLLHPMAVLGTLRGRGFSTTCLCAAVLHDVLEEKSSDDSIEQQLFDQFGEEVYFLVSALSKDFSIADKRRRDRVYFDQLAMAMQRDSAVLFIKMADLLHNATTIGYLSVARRKQWICELKEFYLFHFLQNFHLVPSEKREFYLELLNRLERVVEGTLK